MNNLMGDELWNLVNSTSDLSNIENLNILIENFLNKCKRIINDMDSWSPYLSHSDISFKLYCYYSFLDLNNLKKINELINHSNELINHSNEILIVYFWSACLKNDIDKFKDAINDIIDTKQISIAFYIAIENNYIEIVKLFFEIGFNFFNEQYILDICLKKNYYKLLKFILQNSMINNEESSMQFSFNHACINGRIEFVKFCVENFIYSFDYNSGLLFATYHNHYDVTTFLLENGANPNSNYDLPILNAIRHNNTAL